MSEYTKRKIFNRKPNAVIASDTAVGTAAAASDPKFSKKKLISISCAVLILLAVTLILSQTLFDSALGGVEFTVLTAEEIPRSIEKDVIPEYRELERALGCLVEGKVYVVVTRGEKPTAGYELSIEKMTLEKTKSGSNLSVTALFTEPAADKSVSRIITYPYSVAVTELETLPDSIELNVRYAE